MTPDEHPETLTPREAAYVNAVLAAPCATARELAEAIGLSEATIWRYARRESVRAALSSSARVGVHQAGALLGAAAVSVARALVQMALAKRAPSPGRVAACVAVLREGRELLDLEALEQRIEQIEKGGPPPPSTRWGVT